MTSNTRPFAAVTLALLFLFAGLAAPRAGAEDKPLTRREVKERMAKLPDKHRQFLIDVEPVIQQKERDTFLRLETDPQRDSFIDDFWRRRDAAAGTSNFAAHDEYYARLETVKSEFGQVSSDRGKIYLTRGVPLSILDVKCPRHLQPIQVWRYEYLEHFGHNYRILFYIPRDQRDYKLWSPLGGEVAYRDLLSNDINSTGRFPSNLFVDCDNGDELQKALVQMSADSLRLMRLFDPPKLDLEDVTRSLRSAVIADPDAPKLDADMTVSYPYADGNKTDVQLLLHVPRAQLKTTTVGGVSVYTVEVNGEILRDGKMWEKYRYRFDFPGDSTEEKLPLVVDRLLRPATYQARLKLSDPASGAQAILERALEVPEVAAKVTEEGRTVVALQEEMQSSRARLRIVPLGEEVVSGVQTIHTLASGAGIDSVEFWLDGKKVATRRAPPYALDLDFGTVPRTRKIRVVALDKHGQVVTGDEVVVNTGTDPFRVRIASPRVAPKLSGPTRVEIDVRVPEGKQLGSVELYWNETRVATMYDPPFVQTVTIPKSEGVGYLRALAILKDPEADPAEDVVMVNTPDFMETLDVHLVELPTTVLREGKPVHDLQESAFKVLDEGQPVKLAKFEHVSNLPLSVGMAVDTSGSMTAKMPVARDAGAAFFQNVLRSGDKAFLVAFDSQPHMIQKWSPDLKEIFAGLAKLHPEESTALYDAVVYSLYNFLGVKGQKALVVLTDGKDTSSKFSFEQALEYAQRAAVPIYTVGIGIRAAELDVKSKLNRLSSDTGGTSYLIDHANELSRIYADIQNELRSQYVLGFYPSAQVKSGGPWREVSVTVAEGRVKTIRGYYP